MVRRSHTDDLGSGVDHDTSHDFLVGITGIPRSGLGCWPDVQDPSTTTAVVSGNGGKGFYPWGDFTTHTWGIVGVQTNAVRSSQYRRRKGSRWKRAPALEG